MVNKRIKRITAGLLAGTMVLMSAACGKEENGVSESGSGNDGTGVIRNTGGQTVDGDCVYVPKFYDLSRDAEADSLGYGSVSFDGDRLYYICYSYHDNTGDSHVDWCYLDAANPEAGPVVVQELTEYEEWGENTFTNVVYAAACGEDGTVLLLRTSPLNAADAGQEGQERSKKDIVRIKKLAGDGREIFDVDITEYMRTNTGGTYPWRLFTDGKENIYISNDETCIWVFDKEGNYRTDIDLSNIQGYTAAVDILPDGRLGVLHQNGDNMQLEVYNPDTGQFSETYANLPANCLNSNLTEGLNGGILLNGGGSLYEYNPEEKGCRELVKWVNCDISSDSIRQVKVLADGRIAAFSLNWNMDESSLVVMERQQASEAEEKKILTLGCMGLTSIMQEAVVEFNKTSDAYKIEIRDYTEGFGDSGESAGEDAKTLLYNEILAGNVPDMFLAGDIDIRLFAEKGLIEDLSPYLDNSTVIGREDLFETILNAYTMNQTLCAIPTYFAISTLAGRTSEVGAESGWTVEEMIAFAQAHPDAAIMPNATKISVLNSCMLYDMESWVNRETGECFFDTPEFKAVMEFANQYPAQESAGGMDERQQIMEHTALLYPFILSNARSWQFTAAMFNEPVTAIGYPSANANGVRVFGFDAVCISTASENKEGAWAFIETLLTEKVQEDERKWSFSVRISSFEKELAELMEPDYLYGGNGEILLDEDGKPMERGHTYIWADDYEISVYAVTQEEADNIRNVINQIDGVYENDGGMMEIILEETAPYFAGQKSVDETADIIQSRVQLYLHESR